MGTLITVMLARKKDRDHMIDELTDFLDTDTTGFVDWVVKLFNKLGGLSTRNWFNFRILKLNVRLKTFCL